jgi:hypothetical protein
VLSDLKCVFCGNRPPKRPLVRLVATTEAKEFRRDAHRCLPKAPVSGPVELYVTVYVPTLQSDGLNRIKALEDAINERLWFDDKQIAEWHITRVISACVSAPEYGPPDADGNVVLIKEGVYSPPLGVVVEVRPANPLEHPELSRRLAASSIQARANEAAQPNLFETSTERDGSTPPAAGPGNAPMRGGGGVGSPRPRAVLPEPLQQRLNRIATPAVISNRKPEDP